MVNKPSIDSPSVQNTLVGYKLLKEAIIRFDATSFFLAIVVSIFKREIIFFHRKGNNLQQQAMTWVLSQLNDIIIIIYANTQTVPIEIQSIIH